MIVDSIDDLLVRLNEVFSAKTEEEKVNCL